LNKKNEKGYISREDALARLQRYCAYQDRCHQEARGKLLDLGVYGDDLEAVMAELISEGFLNEERYARSFARGKFRLKGWGRVRIRQELKNRQVSDYCIRKAMEEIGEEEYLETLRSMLDRKADAMKNVDEFQVKAKLSRFAIGRGFEPELVWQALEELRG
jgi:regulatory protein